MFSDEWRLVRVRVVLVIVTMHVLVLDRHVNVMMAVKFTDVQVDAEPEQARGEKPVRAGVPVTERPGERRADERRKREHRPRAARTDASLGE